MRQRFYFTKNFYEKRAWADGLLTCGVDEVGRGCLAGPLVVGATILHPNSKYPLLKDSKELGKEELIRAYNWILKHGWSAIALISPADIDRYNIWHATLITMRQAVLNLLLQDSIPKPSIILVDAMPLSLINSGYDCLEIQHFIKGESYSVSIAAASIVAKVTRDRIMQRYAQHFPAYRWDENKGYATQAHQEGLRSIGSSIVHRKTFLKKFAGNQEQQGSIFTTIECEKQI